MPDFYNPYNFVRALRRTADRTNNQFGDGRGPGHDRYRPGHWTGTLKLRLTVETPLVLCDRALPLRENPQHKVHRVRVRPIIGADGKPVMGPKGQAVTVPDLRRSEVRGMLRSAFEMITNSRFGIFAKKHEERLAYRMPPKDPPPHEMVPAIVRSGTVELLPGDGVAFKNFLTSGKVRNPFTSYAARLPFYPTPRQYKTTTPNKPQHLHEVVFTEWNFEHHRWSDQERRPVHDFNYVEVQAIERVPASGILPTPTKPASRGVTPAGGNITGQNAHIAQGKAVDDAGSHELKGWVYVSNKNIEGKHDERVFYNASGTNYSTVLGPELIRFWHELIDNYIAIHKDDLKERWSKLKKSLGYAPTHDQALNEYARYYPPGSPGRAAWSPHVYGDEPSARSWRDIGGNTPQLCYARVKHRPGTAKGYEVVALYPVPLSRDLYDNSPHDLLDRSLWPALSPEELSPADRVFGWVSQERGDAAPRGRGQAYRSRVVVRSVNLATEPPGGAIEPFGGFGLPLAILGQPKPAQGRFYVGQADGTPQADGGSKKQRGYANGRVLRGRKIYPHHTYLGRISAPAGYWINNAQLAQVNGPAAPVGGLYREYVRAGDDQTKQRDSQNRSITGWVRPGTTFEIEVDVFNLPPAELGALLFLTMLPENHFLKLGLGKPLGLGSVRLETLELDLREGGFEKGWYLGFASEPPADGSANWRVRLTGGPLRYDASELRGFHDAFRTAAWAVIDRQPQAAGEWPPQVDDFLKAACGIGSAQAPIHYPRRTVAPMTMGKNYDWFVDNDSKDGPHKCLPAIGGTLPG